MTINVPAQAHIHTPIHAPIITLQPQSHPGMSFASSAEARVEQPARRIRGGCCPGGGLCGVGANKDNEDDRLAVEQRERQAATAAAARPSVPAQPLPVLQPPAQATTREPRTSKTSRTSSLQGGGPGLQQASQSKPDRRMPAKTLPPHLARPDLVQPPRQGGSRTQSMGPTTARPSLP